MDFYSDVLQNLVLALGGALFVGNVLALRHRSRDAADTAQRTVARARPGSPVRGYRRDETVTDLPQAPLARTLLYAAIGLLMVVWWLGSLVVN
jgi:hypothetical protein